MFCELMGICFSCRRPTSSRLNNKISEHISASVTPLHVCLEEQRGPELDSCNTTAPKLQVCTSLINYLHFHSLLANWNKNNLTNGIFLQIRTSQEKREERKVGGGEEDTEANSVGGAACELKQNQPSMANTISNMKMTNPIKGLVSKRRKRFTEDGFNLDLTCKLFLILFKTHLFSSGSILILTTFLQILIII